MKQVILSAKKEGAVLRRHPWVFSGAIAREDAGIADGERVAVLGADGGQLAVGHYQSGSIRVRLFYNGAEAPPADLWEQKLGEALRVRRNIGLANAADTNAYRLVHGEGDGLPGLIIDVYGGTAVLQCHSIGMHAEREALARALQVIYADKLKAVYDKSRESLPARYAATAQDGYLWGDAETAGSEVKEYGCRFRIDWEGGQKTGFFLDQRENRQLLSHYAPGRRVLNTFCYSGGFSIYALQAGAAHVDSVDVSAKATALVAENSALNGIEPDRHGIYTQEVNAFLRQHEAAPYDIVIVDPPAFAKTLDKRHNAVQGYKRLNALAMQRVAPGGLLFTFSCSQVVDRALFYNTIVAAGLEAGRQMRVLHHLSQGPDHPVSLFHPEGEYLKGLVLMIE
jgi:23S rRNA (cytosine1962-C5)-methyltransferase